MTSEKTFTKGLCIMFVIILVITLLIVIPKVSAFDPDDFSVDIQHDSVVLNRDTYFTVTITCRNGSRDARNGEIFDVSFLWDDREFRPEEWFVFRQGRKVSFSFKKNITSKYVGEDLQEVNTTSRISIYLKSRVSNSWYDKKAGDKTIEYRQNDTSEVQSGLFGNLNKLDLDDVKDMLKNSYLIIIIMGIIVLFSIIGLFLLWRGAIYLGILLLLIAFLGYVLVYFLYF